MVSDLVDDVEVMPGLGGVPLGRRYSASDVRAAVETGVDGARIARRREKRSTFGHANESTTHATSQERGATH